MVTPASDSPAHLALQIEGVEHTEIVVQDPFDYGNLFADRWDEGEPFVWIEHDIIPWPMAVGLLEDCGAKRCSHSYPLGRNTLSLSFGIGKYRPEGPAPQVWRETDWQVLDGEVMPVLDDRLGPICLHEPPVAHVREPKAVV